MGNEILEMVQLYDDLSEEERKMLFCEVLRRIPQMNLEALAYEFRGGD